MAEIFIRKGTRRSGVSLVEGIAGGNANPRSNSFHIRCTLTKMHAGRRQYTQVSIGKGMIRLCRARRFFPPNVRLRLGTLQKRVFELCLNLDPSSQQKKHSPLPESLKRYYTHQRYHWHDWDSLDPADIPQKQEGRTYNNIIQSRAPSRHRRYL